MKKWYPIPDATNERLENTKLLAPDCKCFILFLPDVWLWFWWFQVISSLWMVVLQWFLYVFVMYLMVSWPWYGSKLETRSPPQKTVCLKRQTWSSKRIIFRGLLTCLSRFTVRPHGSALIPRLSQQFRAWQQPGRKSPISIWRRFCP